MLRFLVPDLSSYIRRKGSFFLGLLVVVTLTIVGCAQTAPPAVSGAQRIGPRVDNASANGPSHSASGGIAPSASVETEPPLVAMFEGGDVSPAPTEPSTRLLPIWGDEARKRGYELPLPFGLSPTFTYLEQKYELKELKLGIGSGPPTRPIRFLGFDPIEVKSTTTIMRFDAWVLPFLNVYGIAGYVSGEGRTTVTLPAIPPITSEPRRFPATIDYKGPTYGGGVTLAGGYKHLFVAIDANYTITDLQEAFTADINTLTVSPRVGWNGKFGWFKGAVWAGGMFIRPSQILTAEAKLPSGERLTLRIRQRAIGLWNTVLGFSWDITPHFDFLVEGGFGKRDQVTTSLTLRF